ncbi:unnamed protein product [Urochloa humidicola]
MPMVQSLRFDFRVVDILSGHFDLSMSNLPLLEDIYIDYDMKKATRDDRVRAQGMLSRALKEHPNHPSLHPEFHCEGGEGTDSGRGLDPSIPSCTQPLLQLAEGDVVGIHNPADGYSVVQASIPPVASNRFSSMLWSFIAQSKLEMKLIFSTRIFRCFLIGSLLLYSVFSFCFGQFKKI